MVGLRSAGCLLAISGGLLVGCTPSTAVRPVSDDVSVVDFSADRRGAFVRSSDADGLVQICSEPAPDLAVATAADFATALRLPETVDLSVSVGVRQELLDLARRGQILQVQREALYRICELYANGALTTASTFTLYDEVLFTLRVMALAELLAAMPPEVAASSATFSLLGPALTRSQRPLDAVLRDVPAEVIDVLFSASTTECARLLAIGDAELKRFVEFSTDDVLRRIGRTVDEPGELRRVLEFVCRG